MSRRGASNWRRHSATSRRRNQLPFSAIDNPSMITMFTHLLAKTVSVNALNGAVYTGLFAGTTQGPGTRSVLIHLKFARLVSGAPHPNATVHDQRGCEYAKLQIPWASVTTLKGAMSMEKALETDAQIAKPPVRPGRELKKFDDFANVPTTTTLPVAASLDEQTFGPMANRRWDQFQANESKFGVKTTFDMNEYTTEIDNKVPDFKEKYDHATRLADEINATPAENIHVREERNLSIPHHLDEETRFSGVQRIPAPTASPTTLPATPPITSSTTPSAATPNAPTPASLLSVSQPAPKRSPTPEPAPPPPAQPQRLSYAAAAAAGTDARLRGTRADSKQVPKPRDVKPLVRDHKHPPTYKHAQESGKVLSPRLNAKNVVNGRQSHAMSKQQKKMTVSKNNVNVKTGAIANGAKTANVKQAYQPGSSKVNTAASKAPHHAGKQTANAVIGKPMGKTGAANVAKGTPMSQSVLQKAAGQTATRHQTQVRASPPSATNRIPTGGALQPNPPMRSLSSKTTSMSTKQKLGEERSQSFKGKDQLQHAQMLKVRSAHNSRSSPSQSRTSPLPVPSIADTLAVGVLNLDAETPNLGPEQIKRFEEYKTNREIQSIAENREKITDDLKKFRNSLESRNGVRRSLQSGSSVIQQSKAIVATGPKTAEEKKVSESVKESSNMRPDSGMAATIVPTASAVVPPRNKTLNVPSTPVVESQTAAAAVKEVVTKPVGEVVEGKSDGEPSKGEDSKVSENKAAKVEAAAPKKPKSKFKLNPNAQEFKLNPDAPSFEPKAQRSANPPPPPAQQQFHGFPPGSVPVELPQAQVMQMAPQGYGLPMQPMAPIQMPYGAQTYMMVPTVPGPVGAPTGSYPSFPQPGQPFPQPQVAGRFPQSAGMGTPTASFGYPPHVAPVVMAHTQRVPPNPYYFNSPPYPGQMPHHMAPHHVMYQPAGPAHMQGATMGMAARGGHGGPRRGGPGKRGSKQYGHQSLPNAGPVHGDRSQAKSAEPQAAESAPRQ